ncbi:MAG: GNAT family N-acetyltransferase [Proteobacteria bacterium]|nr:GNAT family N-acetyltransferase [Pseudomonadota bacterium]
MLIIGPMESIDPEPTIKKATAAAAPALAKIEAACFDYDCMSESDFRHYLTKTHNVTLLAEENGKTVAYGMVFLNNKLRQARLFSIAVLPSHRGQGLSQSVYGALENAARDAGMYTMRLEVREDNPTLQDMYGRWGFATCGGVQGYYSDGGDALKMKKLIV